MFRYYLDLALLSLRKNKVLTALMIVAIALGIGASMTTLTVLRILAGDPLPEISDTLFAPQLDVGGKIDYRPDNEPADQLTRLDAEALLRAKRADRQALMTGGDVAVNPERDSLRPFNTGARYTSADFFAMFNVPFAFGRSWQEAEDRSSARVAVISKELNDKLFSGVDSVGKGLEINGTEFRIVGVLEHWRPSPRFYDLSSGNYANAEQVYLPFSTSRQLDLPRSGNMNCFDDRPPEMKDTDVGAPCTWIQFWVQLDSRDKADAYMAFLRNYSDEQRAAGRYERPTNVRLRSLMQWLDYKNVVPDDAKLQTYLAFGFLVVCLINTVGLLLAKFLRRAPEIGVRRALGASRRAVFAQFLVEAGLIGIAGGALGLGLAWLGLWAVRQQPTDYAALIHLDLPMLLTTFALALVASLAAGLLPAFRACQITPAMQLKSQ
ncbi:MAG TPA: ABC transporter permease [Kofleriaceae bacterium]|nr:ABC transporter permease [Kofleriaceae bacterium]